LTEERERVFKKIFNAGYENHRVSEIAQMVRSSVLNKAGNEEIEIEIVPTDDDRSYHISSSKIEHELGFTPKHTIEDAVSDLVEALHAGKLVDPMSNSCYFNIKKMQEVKLQ
ncbi:MAG: NAD(P)-dependent oxidoreductase, partial [Bdellovibrionales bacterium]|nr:NAD(P)-dependent oxidoreductase [Bdellovibrionales bacterium]